jgi:hypothetical protein
MLGQEKFVKATFPGKVYRFILTDETSFSVLESGKYGEHRFPIIEVRNSNLKASFDGIAIRNLRYFIFISGNEIAEVLADAAPAIALP